MINYDAIKEIYRLQRNRKGKIVGKTPIHPKSFRWLLDQDGNVPEPPHPACQIKTMGMPYLLAKDEIEVQYHEVVP